MARLRRPAPTRLTDLDGPGGWLLAGVAAVYVAASTWWWTVPVGPGLPFVACWAALSASGAIVARLLARRTGRRFSPLWMLALLAGASVAVTDVAQAYQPLRDLGIYLKAGHHFLDGAAVYLQAPLTARPDDRSDYPFLYPPLTLPFFAALASIPDALARALWPAMSLLLGALALRLIGLRWRWVALALLWPPFFQGLWVGNVAVPALILFAAAPRVGAGLPVAAIFKSYTGIAALWLVRSGRWLELAIGLGLVAAVGLATLPLTGFDAWRAWFDGLGFYSTSQHLVPALYGFGLPGLVPYWAFLLMAGAAVAAALRAPGRDGLARLGVATVVASPSLWNHGMLVTVPALMTLRLELLWFAVVVTAVPDGPGWWWLVVLVVGSWSLPSLRRRQAREHGLEGALDPLVEGATGPWPSLPPEAGRSRSR